MTRISLFLGILIPDFSRDVVGNHCGVAGNQTVTKIVDGAGLKPFFPVVLELPTLLAPPPIY